MREVRALRSITSSPNKKKIIRGILPLLVCQPRTPPHPSPLAARHHYEQVMHRHRSTGLKQVNKSHKGSKSSKRATSRRNRGRMEKPVNLKAANPCVPARACRAKLHVLAADVSRLPIAVVGQPRGQGEAPPESGPAPPGADGGYPDGAQAGYARLGHTAPEATHRRAARAQGRALRTPRWSASSRYRTMSTRSPFATRSPRSRAGLCTSRR